MGDQVQEPSDEPWYQRGWAKIAALAGAFGVVATAVTNADKIGAVIWPRPKAVEVAITEPVASYFGSDLDQTNAVLEIKLEFTASKKGDGAAKTCQLQFVPDGSNDFIKLHPPKEERPEGSPAYPFDLTNQVASQRIIEVFRIIQNAKKDPKGWPQPTGVYLKCENAVSDEKEFKKLPMWTY